MDCRDFCWYFFLFFFLIIGFNFIEFIVEIIDFTFGNEIKQKERMKSNCKVLENI